MKEHNIIKITHYIDLSAINCYLIYIRFEAVVHIEGPYWKIYGDFGKFYKGAINYQYHL